MSKLAFIINDSTYRATIVASSTSGSLVANNVKTDERSEVWRSVGTSATLTMTWPTAENIGAMAFGWTNMTATGTVQIEVYALDTDPTPMLTNTFFADNALPLGEFNFGNDPLLAGSAQAAGMATQVQAWLTQQCVARKVVVTFTDTNNPDGYVQVAKICTGVRYSLSTNPSYGVNLEFIDRSIYERTESGVLRSDARGLYRKVTMDYRGLNKADLVSIMNVLYNARTFTTFLSVFPGEGDIKAEAYAMFGKIVGGFGHAYSSYNRWDFRTLTFEEVA